jgi:hypothetical protein
MLRLAFIHDAHEVNTQEIATDQSSDAARKYHIWTIGCQMNVADSNHVAAELEKIGYGPTDRWTRPMWSCSTPASCARAPRTRPSASWATSSPGRSRNRTAPSR